MREEKRFIYFYVTALIRMFQILKSRISARTVVEATSVALVFVTIENTSVEKNHNFHANSALTELT